MKEIQFSGKSQYDTDIDERYRPSACGPVTAFTLLRHHGLHGDLTINDIYKRLGGTPIGLFTWRYIRNMRKLLGPGWLVARCTVNDVKQEIDAGRPAAAKFDKWFTLRWRGSYAFDYHWVPVVGYEETDGDILLLIHDNGGRGRGSRLRAVSYKQNRHILTFVKLKAVPSS